MEKRNGSRAISLLLALALALTMIPAGLAVDYVDMPTDWAHDAVQAGVDAGLIVPDGEGKLNPAKALTRAEVADIMVRAFGSGGKADLSGFADVPRNHPCYEALSSAVYMGLMSGGGGKMSPDAPVTREQAFVILNNSLKVGSDPAAVEKFSDAGRVSDWAKGACGALVTKGYVSGSGSNLNPQNNVTRQELLQILYNIFGANYVSSADVYKTSTDKSLVVNAPEAALSAIQVNGDLVIGDGVSRVKLNSVTVRGRLVVRTGGQVELQDCKIAHVVSVKEPSVFAVQSTGGARPAPIPVSGGEAAGSGDSDALRQKVLDYMRAESAIQWTPAETFTNDSKSYYQTYEKGTVYTGMPYGNDVDASILEFMSVLDADNVYHGGGGKTMKGVDCTSSILAAWCQVAASVDYAFTLPMLPYANAYGSHGATPLGDLKLPEETTRNTNAIITMNGEQAVYEAYTKALPADVVVHYSGGGHARMLTEEPHVVRNADGTIDPQQSYLTTIEIGNYAKRQRAADGKYIMTNWIVDYKYSFEILIKNGYLPFSCPELLAGKSPEVEITVEDQQDVAANKGLTGMMRSNYRIFRAKAVITDASGKTVATAEEYPLNMVNYAMDSNNCGLAMLNDALGIASLPAGSYVLTLTAVAGSQEVTVLTQSFQI